MANIREFLVEMNPWWKGKFDIEYKEREIYTELEKYIKLPQIISFSGLRRVGKTTLMLKIAEDEVERGSIEKSNVLYFSFDENMNSSIRNIIEEYEKIMEKDVKNGRFLFLFDEIQKLHDWESQLKAVYDIHKKNVKMIITGSESLFIRKKSKETLAGRIFEFKIKQLSFREFLSFRNIDYRPIGIYKKELMILFGKYLKTAGFPELIDITDEDIIRKYIKEGIAEKIVYRDIPLLYGIKNTSTLNSLLNIFMEEPGEMAKAEELAKELGVSRQTIMQYISYLEDSFLLKKLYNYSGSRRKTERKIKKYYPAIISPSLLFRDDPLSESKVFEWAIVNGLDAEFFWRDPYKNEVDIILPGKQPIPVEVKHGKIKIEGLTKFMDAFKVRKGYIIHPEREDKIESEEKTISIIPAYKLFLDKTWKD